jgi:hypothetical protein
VNIVIRLISKERSLLLTSHLSARAPNRKQHRNLIGLVDLRRIVRLSSIVSNNSLKSSEVASA